MQVQGIKLIARKVITPVITAMIFGLIFSSYNLIGNDSIPPYSRGEEFIAWALILFFYSGFIILIYGTPVSLLLEFILRKKIPKYNWLYILFHALFGGLFFYQKLDLMFLGIVPALIYSIVDRWLYTKNLDGRHITFGFLSPIALAVVLWLFFSLISESRPPFTSEEAIALATFGEDTISSTFPKGKDKWSGNIEGFNVSRKTSAIKIGDDQYLVTFTETWEKGYLNGTYSVSYIVNRNSVSLHSEGGKSPPYYKK